MRPFVAFLVLPLSLLSVRASAQPCNGCPAPSFAPSPRYFALPPLVPFQPSSVGPAAVAVDLNGDGFPDLAITAQDGVAVLIADGEGGFGPASLFSGPQSEASIAAGDFDRDGHADIVTTAGFGVYFWHGDGTGALGPAVGTSLGVRTQGVAGADLDADGKPDLVVGLDTGNAVRMGDGLGGFGPPQVIGTEPVMDLTLADLNHDGRPDLVTVGPQGVGVRLGNGSGGFGPPAWLTAGLVPRDVEAADVDGDSHLDLVVLNYGDLDSGVGASVSVLRGNGGGFFAPAVSQAVGVRAMTLAVSDFNRDGHADVAVVSELTLTVLLGQANATLLPRLVVTTNNPEAVATGDFDRDGLPDITTVGSGAGLFLGEGTGGLELPAFFDTGGRPRGLAAGDFNADGVPDVAASRDTNDIAILFGATGGFVAGPTIPVGAKPGTLASADFNDDGRTDLAVLADATDRVRVFLAVAGGGFSLASSFPAGPYPGGLAVGDLNGDGRPDIVAGNAQEGEALYTFLGNGDGTFGAAQTVSADRPSLPMVADVNHDGHLDVITLPNFEPVYLDGEPLRRPDGLIPNIQLFLGNGDGSLQPAVSVPLPSDPSGLALGDVDGDGDPDLFVGATGGVYLALNGGGGDFGAPVLIYPAQAAGPLTLADVNGDGRLDVIASLQPAAIKVLVADGVGGFQEGAGYAERPFGAVVAVDLDADSRPELVYATFDSTGIKLLWNTNCQARRFRIATDIPACNTPGVPFATQPIVHWIDDGGNRVQCAVGDLNAVFVPGTGMPGAAILGTATVPFVSGIATFTDLAVDLPGSSYQLKYERAASPRRVRGRSFSQGLTVEIEGPGVVQAGTSASYAASPGFRWYDWTLDAAPVSTAQSTSLGFPSNGTYALAVAARQDGCSVYASRDIVAGPLASATGGSVVEGDSGQTALSFTLTLSAPSAVPVGVYYDTADITAWAGHDYLETYGFAIFTPGQTALPLDVPVLGDALDEPDEIFALRLVNASNAVVGPDAVGRILDDDGTLSAGLPGELVHGSERRDSLSSIVGEEQSRFYVLRQQGSHSYEVIVDGVSGDVTPLELELLDGNGNLIQAASTGAGSSASLRFENPTIFDEVAERVHARSGGCATTCGPEAGYRIRAFDTASSIARFNNQGSQVTVLVLSNASDQDVAGHARFWSESGSLLLTHAFFLGPHASQAVNTASLPGLAGQKGAVGVASNAPYGALAGKASAVEPAQGFSFDTPLEPRPR